MSREPARKESSWRNDEFARHEVSAHWWWLVIPVIGLLAALLLPTMSCVKKQTKTDVILYCAQDQVFAEPLLKEFEKQTGIRVKAVFDSEAVKTVGLANRLIAEKSHPQADVFWGNEEIRTRQLVEQGVFTNGFTPLAGYHRLRQIVVNTNFVAAPLTRPSGTLSPSDGERDGVRGGSVHGKPPPPTLDAHRDHEPQHAQVVDSQARHPAVHGEASSAPRSLAELTNATWRGKVALAYPMFGTTSTHFLALRQAWGEARWLEWCRALVANKALVVDGNSVVVKLVGRGEAWVGLTDSDDIAAFQREGLPIAAINFAETLRIPNTVAIVTGAPHPENAAKLVAFLNRDDIKRRLAEANAFVPVKAEDPIGLRVDWDALLRDQDKAVAGLKEIFLR